MSFMSIPRFPRRAFLRSLICLLALVLAPFVWAAPPDGVLDASHASVQAVIAVQNDVTPGLMSVDGVIGTAVGLDADGQAALVVYVDRGAANVAALVKSLPPALRGIGVQVELTDKFVAMRGKPGGGGGSGDTTPTVSHTAKQTTPIKLGTSGGWRTDLANGYCCGGTLGALVQVNGTKYILSNYHVLEADIVSGGNGIVATDGSYVIQPGLIDVGCNANNAQNVGTLKVLKSLPGSNVDCAVAQVINGFVDPSGAILEIGTLSSQTLSPRLNLAVKKSGRTTALSRSKISGLNATVSVAYDNECAGGSAFTKTFTGQIVIGNKGAKFLNGGDSGSVMVEDVTSNPRAVGLLYAGSSVYAIANPIDEVLGFIGSKLGGNATMVGQ